MATSENAVIIPVEFDVKKEKLENKINQITRSIEEETSKKELFSEQFDLATKHTKEFEEEIGKANDEILKLQKRLEGIQSTPIKTASVFKEGQRTIEAIDTQKLKIKEIQEELSKESIKQEEIGQKIKKQENIIKKKNEDLQNTNNELELIKQKQEEQNRNDETHDFNIKKIIKSVLKWSLALFSIRSVYSMIRGAVSTLLQSNEQISADIEYMRWVLAQTLKPIIEFIVNLVYSLLQIINAISMALFGVNLFANKTTAAFQDQNKALKGSNKEAQELKKTLAGFDEMNIIQDNGSVASGGGGGGAEVPTPGIDLSQVDFSLVELFTKWKDMLLNWWDDIVQFWETDWKAFFDSIGGDFGDFFSGIGRMLHGFWEVLKGFGEMVIGLLDILWGIITLDFDRIKEGFGILIDGMWKVLKGLLEMIVGALLSAIGLMEGIFKTFVGWIYDFVIVPVIGTFTGLWELLVKGAKLAWDGIKAVFSTVASFFGTVFGNAWNLVKNIFSTGGQIFMGIVDGIAQAFGRIVNAIIGGLNSIIAVPFNKINGVLNWIKDIDLPLIGKPFYGFWKYNPIPIPQIPLIPLAKGGIVNMPGSGVPIAGERGREAVIPLTDSQQMDLLGQAIGKNVTLNATIPVYVGNRQIAREIRKINTESDFAYNR